MTPDASTGSPDPGPGTVEALWRSWPSPAAWPPLELPPAVDVVAVSPHPDDVVLAIGGLLRLLAERGSRVSLVAVTDGESSHPDSDLVTPTALARRRRAEDRSAFAALGIELAEERRLGFPDGGVAVAADRLRGALGARVRPSTLLLAPWERDGHPDHDATGRVALAAAAAAGARCWRYPVWTWHWADPASLDRWWDAPARVDLPGDVVAAKRAAIGAYRSQIAPLGPGAADAAVVPPAVRAHFERRWETVLP